MKLNNITQILKLAVLSVLLYFIVQIYQLEKERAYNDTRHGNKVRYYLERIYGCVSEVKNNSMND